MSNKPEHTADISAELRTLSRSAKQYGLQPTVYGKPINIYFAELADRFDAAHKREVDALKQRLAELNAEIAAKDAVIMRLNDALAEEQGRKMTTAEKNAAKLPDGWKMYDKYQIRHTDGTPLKGKRYFVLRLDSDDPLEAARVAAAMSAYKGETPHGNLAKLREALSKSCAYFAVVLNTGMFNRVHLEALLNMAKAALAAPARECDVGTVADQLERFEKWFPTSPYCDGQVHKMLVGYADWVQMPNTESGATSERGLDT